MRENYREMIKKRKGYCWLNLSKKKLSLILISEEYYWSVFDDLFDWRKQIGAHENEVLIARWVFLGWLVTSQPKVVGIFIVKDALFVLFFFKKKLAKKREKRRSIYTNLGI